MHLKYKTGNVLDMKACNKEESRKMPQLPREVYQNPSAWKPHSALLQQEALLQGTQKRSELQVDAAFKVRGWSLNSSKFIWNSMQIHSLLSFLCMHAFFLFSHFPTPLLFFSSLFCQEEFLFQSQVPLHCRVIKMFRLSFNSTRKHLVCYKLL